MGSANGAMDVLLIAHGAPKAQEDGGGNGQAVIHNGELLAQRGDVGRATARSDEAHDVGPVRGGKAFREDAHCNSVARLHSRLRYRVLILLSRSGKTRSAVVDEENVGHISNVSLGETESGSQLFFLAGHAHKDSDALAIDQDLERFLQGNVALHKFGLVLASSLYRPA
jgi:hypothetical protein